MQQHDWRVRPFDASMLSYLATDVAHLEALEETIWREVGAHGIEDEVLEETRYRLRSAATAARTPQTAPAYTRIKGIERYPERERAVLMILAELREREAQRRDVPPYRVASTEALVAAARARPATAAELARVRGFSLSSPAARFFAEEVVGGIAAAGDSLPETERARFERPRLPDGVLRARREREVRLLAWRRAEAKRRGVDEQVILPGHCVKDAVEADPSDTDGLGRVPGIGAFRVERDGAAILHALRGEGVGP
jgi:ribonuclease D